MTLPQLLPQRAAHFRATHLILTTRGHEDCAENMIRKLNSGKFRLYSRKKDPRTGKRRNLGTFDTRKAAEAHERAVQYFKHH